MNLSDDDFSTSQVVSNFSETDFSQRFDEGFYPKYDWRCNHEEALEEEIVEQPAEPTENVINQQVTEAYAQGYLNGQQAAMVHHDYRDEAKASLAAALNRLKVVNEDRLAKPLWETILALFEKAVGHVAADRELVQRRCDAAVALLQEAIGEPCLYVAASDADILKDYDCDIRVETDSTLLPGSVRLIHAEGQVISGTAAIAHAIESRIESAECGSC